MKTRRVILTLEVETDAPVEFLRKKHSYSAEWMLRMFMSEPIYRCYYIEIIQAQANVQQEKRPVKGTP